MDREVRDRKTIEQLKNRIKQLEISLEAHDDGVLLKQRDDQILALEKQQAKRERQVDELEQSLQDLQSKYDANI